MPIYDPNIYLDNIVLNQDVVERHIEGLTHSDSMLSP